jgi:N,N'-diacetyllegionaminate synthase
MTTLIIAEAGVNHNGDAALAERLVDAAADAGADFVKFQTFSADRLVTVHAAKADYQRETTDAAESQHAMLRRLEMPRALHETLMARCVARGVGFLSTAFDLESLELLAALRLPFFKIPSGEITNLPYLRQISGYGKPVILSTGMATLQEIEAALHILEQGGLTRDRVTVLHCHTEYPTPMPEVNLRAMLTIRDTLRVAVGYSDHTLGIEVPVAAVALGATIIEKHFTLDRALPGPDHKASLEAAELKAMVTAIRNIEQALGDGIKQPSPREAKNRASARKSLVASRAIRAGEVFSENNIGVKRPGTGISPMRWDEVVGRTAARGFAPDELIEL